MLTEEQLEMLGDAMTPIFQELEMSVIDDIARRVADAERWTETAARQAEALRELGWSPYRIRIEVLRKLRQDQEYAAFLERESRGARAAQQAALEEARRQVRAAAPRLYDAAGGMAFAGDRSVWERAGQTLARSGAVDRMIELVTQSGAEELIDLTRSLGFLTPTGAVSARQAYVSALNSALTQVVSGNVSYQQACADAVRTLARSGLRTVDFASGVTRQLDTTARNAVLTSAGQLSGRIMQENIEETGVPMVQVSAHWGARESHAAWQGRVYTTEQFKSVCGYGEPSNPDHIYSYNCRHAHYPYWPGISEPIEYAKEPGPFEVNGKTYTYYQATQKQRAMERDIRALKRDALAQDALGDKTALAAAKIRLDEKTASYKAFSAQVNMRPKLERISVFGYDRGVAARGRGAISSALRDFGVPPGSMFRNPRNKGVFAVLPERMTKKHIREIARDVGISLKGLSLAIDANPEMLSDRCWFTGIADSGNIGRIVFFPKSFTSRESLIRTLYHERVHVQQFTEHGTEYVQNNRVYFEKLAEEAEEVFIKQIKREGKL